MRRSPIALTCAAALASVAATAAFGAEGRGCASDHYAAIFAPWSDQANAPLLWLVSEGGVIRTVDVPVAEVRAIACTATSVLLRVDGGVVNVDVGNAVVARAPSSAWKVSKAELRRSFDLKKSRIVDFADRQIVVARAAGGPDRERQTFTAILLARMPPRGETPVLVFSRHTMAIKVD
jgi:hypothetical protein